MRIKWKNLEEAHEIVDIRTVLTDPSAPVSTYKSADDPNRPGDTEIPAGVWSAGYQPPLPYIANTTRNLQFNQSSFIASPGVPDGVTTYVTTSDGYTWGAMSLAINAMWPFNAADYSGLSKVSPYYAGNLVTTPDPGVVKVTANFKAQYMKFWANEGGAKPGSPGAVPIDRYFVTDQWGNEYIMHASGQLDPAQVAAAFDAAVLPAGWTKSVRQLSKDLVLKPAEGSDGSYHYLVFRDSADNTYHQISWSGKGSLAGRVEGMPIWGGQTNDTLSGGAGDDLVHGAGGSDVIRGKKGSDTLYGDAGNDVLRGGKGKDVLQGDEGSDKLRGGKGADQFVFTEVDPKHPDTIRDFKPGVDKIVLAADRFSALGDELDAYEFQVVPVLGWSKTPGDGEGYVIYNSRTGKLYYAAEDDKAPKLFVQLGKHLDLSHDDFLMA